MKKLLKNFRCGEKGFTLIELLVVVAVLGVLAAVAVPNVGKFIDTGKEEAYATELQNVQTAVTAMLADSTNGYLDAAVAATADMSTVVADTGTVALSDYMTGLDGTSISSGCTYAFDVNGGVTQTTP